MADKNIKYITVEDLVEMLSVDPEAFLLAVDVVNKVPYKLKISTLMESVSSFDFVIDGGQFINT